jgi:hypothetical protein
MLYARSIIVSASCWQLHTYEVLICVDRFPLTADADGQLTGDHGLKHAYRLMWRITALPSIRSLTLVLLTSKIPFSVADSVLALKVSFFDCFVSLL